MQLLLAAFALSPLHVGRLVRDRYVVIPNWLSTAEAQSLQADALAVEAAGDSFDSHVGTSKMGTARLEPDIRVSRQCPLIPPPPTNAGCLATRERLNTAVRELREDLERHPALNLPALAPFSTELGYLLYPKGGHYRRHLDTSGREGGWTRQGRQASDGGSLSGFRTRRVVSFLLYLNSFWDAAADGGELRIFPVSTSGVNSPAPASRSETLASVSASAAEHFEDISPEGGTLVLFLSAEVEHAVCVTRRERQCVVGWFREAQEGRVPDLDPMSLRTALPWSGAGGVEA